MDPRACIDRLLEAYAQCDAAEITDAAGDLLGWLLDGGFMPIHTERERVRVGEAIAWAVHRASK